MMKDIYSFHTNKGFGLNKDRDIELLDNFETILKQ